MRPLHPHVAEALRKIGSVTIDRAEATRILTEAIQNGEISGGSYYADDPDNPGEFCRCSIGRLLPPEMAEHIEALQNGVCTIYEGVVHCTYPMARALIETGVLLVPEEEQGWFEAVQNATDNLQPDEGKINTEHYLAMIALDDPKTFQIPGDPVDRGDDDES